MLIKKNTTHQPQKNNTYARLEAYARQGRSYRKTKNGKRGSHSTLLKSSLAAIIPLAAAGTLNAQTGCQQMGSSINLTLNFVNGGTNSTAITVGGEYVTFQAVRMMGGTTIDLSLKVTGANIQFLRHTAAFVITAAIPNNEVTRSLSMTNGGNPLSFGNNGRVCNGSYFSFSGSSSGIFGCTAPYIPIKQTNETPHRPGWIQIQVVNVTVNQIQFKILQRGVEDPSNTPENSAVFNDCTTMAAPLPVEMTHFRTTPQDKHIQLDWATASELNNEGFEVQRSTDGRIFTKVGWVNGNGTTNEEQTYRFLDDEVQPNTLYYYRLQQMDTDGTSAFSPVRSAMVEDASVVQVSEFFPNPVGRGRAAARFNLNMPEDGQLGIQVFDARGGLVKELKREYATGRNTLAVPIRDLPAGQYFVKMQLGQEVVYRKLVVN